MRETEQCGQKLGLTEKEVAFYHALAAHNSAIEARYVKAKAHVEKLTQSILGKAFRGELFPQDPNDEPASVLLERIRANRGLVKTSRNNRIGSGGKNQKA